MITKEAIAVQARQILRSSWDPIGVADVPQAHDEYEPYVADLARMILAGGPASELASHLLGIERSRMGLSGDPARARKVADELLALRG